MAFNLKQMISKNQLKPEYICTQFMFEVDESTMKKIDPSQQFALGQIEIEDESTSTITPSGIGGNY
jgi:hypothetical protein